MQFYIKVIGISISNLIYFSCLGAFLVYILWLFSLKEQGFIKEKI